MDVISILDAKKAYRVLPSGKCLFLHPIGADEAAEGIVASAPTQSQDLAQRNLEIVNAAIDSDVVQSPYSDLLIPFVIITVILGGLTVYYLRKSLKKSK